MDASYFGYCKSEILIRSRAKTTAPVLSCSVIISVLFYPDAESYLALIPTAYPLVRAEAAPLLSEQPLRAARLQSDARLTSAHAFATLV